MTDQFALGSAEERAEDEEPPGLRAFSRTPQFSRPSPVSPIPLALLSESTAPRRRAVPRLVVSERSRWFRKRFYPSTTTSEWNDWHWQNRNRIRSAEQLARLVRLSPDEGDAIGRHSGPLPVGITPYYAALLSEDDPAQPLRRTVVPSSAEYVNSARHWSGSRTKS